MLTTAVVVALALVSGPAPPATKSKPATSPLVSRRSALAASALLANSLVQVAVAGDASMNTRIPDDEVVEAQLPRSNKIDLNNAIVVDYKALPGMYPRVAGIIASHGPYTKVSDVYQLPEMTQGDKDMMRKYEKELTVLPPGRMFKERINQRQSSKLALRILSGGQLASFVSAASD
eukprot:CAMPEP_0119406868 /NCGR_PEP_ID=MMETSP1335-20130426/1031_1 /TAXON_ID=259385 /ORGANISM="Chrysoculter rhomboideus, Strain RCC1486" /LENGTH=175 /DNA_ID=CAMNT_0007430961 /DNA_START=32 /DNA_END=560 /DNA_ORIENTATION=-